MSDEEERQILEVAEWCERQYREVGVTPALREVYEFYQKHYGHRDPGPTIIIAS